MISRRAFLSLFPKVTAVVAGAGALVKSVVPETLTKNIEVVQYSLGVDLKDQHSRDYYLKDADAWFLNPMRSTETLVWSTDDWRLMASAIPGNKSFPLLRQTIQKYAPLPRHPMM